MHARARTIDLYNRVCQSDAPPVQALRSLGLKLVHDIAPARVCRRSDLLDLGVEDRRFGYPVELLVRAQKAGWVLTEHDIAYRPRAEGTRSKVSGSVRGTLRAGRDFARVVAVHGSRR